jgi:CBS domain-containing protein/sporulation protein YlmC with PRC-barrel domain
MPYLSELVGRQVADVNGALVGRLEDVVATVHGEMPHPIVVALAVKRSGGTLAIPFSNVAVLLAPAIALKVGAEQIVPYALSDQDLYLVRDVLDKQIIDTNGIRVVRVNDLELARVNGHFYVANVDISGLGLMRRLGLARPVEKIASRFGRRASSTPIRWDDVELLPGDQPLRLKVPSDKITDLHPADLAEILSDLSRSESSKFLESLDIETVADALEEVEPDFQASLVEAMPDEKVADLLEEMAPDEAADLLAELPEGRSQELLSLMDTEEAEDVRKLLAYPEDSAGGIMTTEFIAIPPNLKAEQAIAYLRENADQAETIFYIYVTDSESHLRGVFSLQDLVLAGPATPVDEFMHHRVVTVNAWDSQDNVAQAIAKYNLLAIPVVDEQGRLHGIVTADDALDKIIPTAWKKRLPRMYRQ